MWSEFLRASVATCEDIQPVSQQPSKTEAAYPEYAVRRDTISGFFSPPLPSSTFHDLVNKGKIVPVKGLRGFYRLNDSLRRLGLREVAHLPSKVSLRPIEDIVRLAFALIDSGTFPAPAWMLLEDDLDPRDYEHARLIADLHREAVLGLQSDKEKCAYAEGVLDAQEVIKAEFGTKN